MKKYNVTYSINLTAGVRFLELWCNSVIAAVSVAKDQIAAENDIPIKTVHIIKCENITI